SVNVNSIHRFRRGPRLDHAIELSVRSIPQGIRWAIDSHNRSPERGGEVERAGIAADDDLRVLQEEGQFREARLRRDVGADRLRKVVLAGTPRHERLGADAPGELR